MAPKTAEQGGSGIFSPLYCLNFLYDFALSLQQEKKGYFQVKPEEKKSERETKLTCVNPQIRERNIHPNLPITTPYTL